MRSEEQISAGTRVNGKRTLLTLVIPTRNEAGYVPRLLRGIGEAPGGGEYAGVF